MRGWPTQARPPLARRRTSCYTTPTPRPQRSHPMRNLITLAVCLTLAAPLIRAGDKTPTADKEKVLKRFADEFVTLTPGKDKFPASFTMGGEAASEKPAHEVKPHGSFAVNKYELTQELYEAVMGKNPSKWK